MNGYIYETSGSYGQMCAQCSRCDNHVWYGWYIKKRFGMIQRILCPSCYDYEVLGYSLSEEPENTEDDDLRKKDEEKNEEGKAHE